MPLDCVDVYSWQLHIAVYVYIYQMEYHCFVSIAAQKIILSYWCASPRGEAKADRTQPVATDPAKKLRNLRKKLRDIESLEAKLSSGEIQNPEKEQLEKVSRKADVEQEIKELEKIVEGWTGKNISSSSS